MDDSPTSDPNGKDNSPGPSSDDKERDLEQKRVRGEISCVDGASHLQSLRQAWVAYNIGLMKRDYFGGQSFAWIALGEIFDAIRDIEEEERALLRQANA